MQEREIKEVAMLLQEAGWEAMVCDTPVPYSENGVPAGIPRDMGDYDGEYILLPRQIVGCEPLMMLAVRGESMCGAGIENGDMVTIRLCENAEDGDIVVAWLDGEVTLKAFCRDEQGEAWLLPQNAKYEPVRLSNFSDVRILGRVVDVKKRVGRVAFRSMQQQLRAARRKDESRLLSDETVRHAVMKTVAKMTNSRQWYCIYRVLADKGYLHAGAFYELKTCMDRLFPDNDFSINTKDLGRMSTGTFAKKLIFWDAHDAPVQGKRFSEYLLLAQTFKAMLEHE